MSDGAAGSERLAKLAPGSLDDAQRALYESIAGGPRAAGPQLFRLRDDDGGLEGPFNAMLLSPPVGAALQELGAAVRYGSQLTDRAREIAILVVSAHWDSAFERYAHEAVGRAAGLTEAELDSVRRLALDELDDAEERLVATTTLALASDGDLDDDAYATAVETFGRAVVFELTTLVGYYATLALQLRIFRVPTPE